MSNFERTWPPGWVHETLTLDITCAEPLYLGGRRPFQQYREAEPVLRGNRLLALVAERLRPQCPGSGIPGSARGCPDPEKCEYHLLFAEQEAIAFYDAWPIGQRILGQPMVLPLTAETCKMAPGFCSTWTWTDREEPAHGIWDTLLDQYATTRRNGTSTAHRESCPRCGGPTESISGYAYRKLFRPHPRSRVVADDRLTELRYEVARPEPYRAQYERMEPSLSRRGHTALSRITGTAEHGMIFSNELHIQQSRFLARVRLSAPDEGTLARKRDTLLKALETPGKVGGGRSRGLGLIRVERAGEEMAVPEIPIAGRVQALNTLVKERVERSDDKVYFTITLQSRGFPGLEAYLPFPSKQALQAALFPELDDCELVFYQHRLTQQRGWSTLWNLPKPTWVQVAPGSVYLFRAPAWSQALEAKLQAMEDLGVGDRCIEGFGQVSVCDPFHQEVWPV
jgi:CRISPR-associated protein Csx10